MNCRKKILTAIAAAMIISLLSSPSSSAQGSGDAQETTLLKLIADGDSHFGEWIGKVATQIETLETIYGNVKEGTDLAYKVYSGSQFIFKAEGAISDLYSLYNRTRYRYQDSMSLYDRLLKEKLISPSEYLRLTQRLFDNLEMFQKDMKTLIDIILGDTKISFADRWKWLEELFDKWSGKLDEIDEQDAAAEKEAAEKQKDEARQQETFNKILGAWSTGYTANDDGFVNPELRDGLMQDKEATKAKLRQALSIFDINNIHSLIRSIILLITALLLPMAIYLMFKGASPQHQDALFKIFAGLAISLITLEMIYVII